MEAKQLNSINKLRIIVSSCVTPTGTSNELDVQNEWEENTQKTHTYDFFFFFLTDLGPFRLCFSIPYESASVARGVRVEEQPGKL